MTALRISIIFLALFVLWTGPGMAAELSLQEGKVVLTDGDKTRVLDEREDCCFDFAPIKNSKLSFVKFHGDKAKELGVQNGIHVFEAGKDIALIPHDYAAVADIAMSPNGKILAVDGGKSADPVRDWIFYSFPETKKLGTLGYVSSDKGRDLVWVNDDVVLVMATEAPLSSEPKTGNELLEQVSVVQYSIPEDKKTILFPGTESCGFFLKDFAEGTVFVESFCTKDETKEAQPGEKLTKKIELK